MGRKGAIETVPQNSQTPGQSELVDSQVNIILAIPLQLQRKIPQSPDAIFWFSD